MSGQLLRIRGLNRRFGLNLPGILLAPRSMDTDGNHVARLKYAHRLLRRSPRNTLMRFDSLRWNRRQYRDVQRRQPRAAAAAALPRRRAPDSVLDAVTGADGLLHPFNMSGRNVQALRTRADVFDGVSGFSGESMTLLGRDAPERVRVVSSGRAMRDPCRHTVIGRDFPPMRNAAVSTAGRARERRAVAAAVRASCPRWARPSGWTRGRSR